MDLKEYIKNKSKEIGIDVIGFTNAEDFKELEDFLIKRRKKNYETEFEEKDIKKRICPSLILNEARSIIVIGVSYYLNIREESSNSKTKGKISKSSLGTDYHDILTEKMEKLVKEIEMFDGVFKYKIGVDTTPLLDRYLAKKSGLGWYGKNSNIINEYYGSFIFLGYIITDLELSADKEISQECGQCDICIRSCPVGAIKANHELNARRCISYLTQTKNDIAYDLREKMGDRLYGCDICQMVCPKNKSVICKSEELKESEDVWDYLDIEELIEMSNREFKEKYGHMAFTWRGKNIIKRNGIIVLGNQKRKGHIKILEKTLEDESVMIRKYSAWAILNIDKEKGAKIIDKHMEKEKDTAVIEEIERLKQYFKI